MKYLFYKTIVKSYTFCLKMRNAYVNGMDWLNDAILSLYACLLCM